MDEKMNRNSGKVAITIGSESREEHLNDYSVIVQNIILVKLSEVLELLAKTNEIFSLNCGSCSNGRNFIKNI